MPDLQDDARVLAEAAAATAATAADRRRPGRREVDPTLIPLLRQPASPDGLFGPEQDDLRAPTGLLVSAAVSALLWAGILFGLRSLLGG